MQSFTGWQYLLIDAANQYGHDKKLFEERIQWTEDNLSWLEDLAGEAENKPLYIKAVQAIRQAQAKIPSGHLVGFDAVCSGIQIMSVVTGCVEGARATGLVDPNVRADAYTATTQAMNEILGSTLNISRSNAKQALMTSFYGSKATPKAIFGEDTKELSAFYKAAKQVAPGAWELLQILLYSWNPYALEHSWVLPDFYEAKVKVMQKVEARIEVDELDHATFTYEYQENMGSLKGLSNAANVVHSLDAYVLRCIHRRCNYDYEKANRAYDIIDTELTFRKKEHVQEANINDELEKHLVMYDQTQMADVLILDVLDYGNAYRVSTAHLLKLKNILLQMFQYKPFPVVSIHDEYKCHPNNMNHLRQQYINILAELSESTVLQFILEQIYIVPVTYTKLSEDLGDKIRGSNYALC